MYGQLGVGSAGTCSAKLSKVSFTEEVTLLKCANFRSIVMTRRNEFYATGRNDFGQLSVGDCNNRFVFTRIPLMGTMGSHAINQVSLGDCFTFFYHMRDENMERSNFLRNLKKTLEPLSQSYYDVGRDGQAYMWSDITIHFDEKNGSE